MKYITTFIIIFLISLNLNAELKTPNILIDPQEVVEIQLSALQNNNLPYTNAGIDQTWEFAHPSNKIYTGPLSKFTNMMHSSSYSIMLNHQSHKIIKVENNNSNAYYFIELTDQSGSIYGFQWTLQKVIKGEFKDCWMTISVSQPMQLSKGT